MKEHLFWTFNFVSALSILWVEMFMRYKYLHYYCYSDLWTSSWALLRENVSQKIKRNLCISQLESRIQKLVFDYLTCVDHSLYATGPCCGGNA